MELTLLIHSDSLLYILLSSELNDQIRVRYDSRVLAQLVVGDKELEELVLRQHALALLQPATARHRQVNP